MPTSRATIAKLFGPDPIQAEQAVAELVREEPQAIVEVLPLTGCLQPKGPAGELRLANLAQHWGEAIVPHLERCIREGGWDARRMSAPFFGGLSGSEAAERSLIGVLRDGSDFDAERIAIDALGWLGADGWAWDIDHLVCTGRWERSDLDGHESISRYPYGKLWPFGVEALARMAALSSNIDRIRSVLGVLDEALRRQMKEAPNVTPSGIQLVQRVQHLFAERHIDALIAQWSLSDDEELRSMYLGILAEVAPIRAAGHLIEVITSSGQSQDVRRAASIALGELRSKEVCRKFAKVLADPEINENDAAIRWAASTLYAAGGEWSDNERLYASLMEDANEPGAQFRFSMAVRGDVRCRDRLEADLDANEPFVRWSAALGLARLLGPESLQFLRYRPDDAGDDLERVAMLSAVVRAGEVGRAVELHPVLQRLPALHLLRSIWRQEILDALLHAHDGQLLHDAWCRQALVGDRKRRYYSEWGRPMPVGAGGSSTPANPPASHLAAAPVSRSTAPAAHTKPPRVFISYSHRDKVWLERFRAMQSPLERAGLLQLWDDTRMQPGKWQKQIEAAMRDADAALFLVSSHFLESDFVCRRELPDLLQRAEAKGLRIVWVLLDVCFWETTAIAQYQGANADRPLTKVRNKADRQAIIKGAWMDVLGMHH